MEHTVPNKFPVPVPIQSQAPVLAPGIQAQLQPQAPAPIVAFEPLPVYQEFNPQDPYVQRDLAFAILRKQTLVRKAHEIKQAADVNRALKKFKAESEKAHRPIRDAQSADRDLTAKLVAESKQYALASLGKKLVDPSIRHRCFAPIAGNDRCSLPGLRPLPNIDVQVTFMPKFCEKHYKNYLNNIAKLNDRANAAIEAYHDQVAEQNDATIESIDDASNAPKPSSSHSIPIKTIKTIDPSDSVADDECDLLSDDDAMDIDPDEDARFARIQQSLRNLADRPQLKEDPPSPTTSAQQLLASLGLNDDNEEQPPK